MNVIQDIDKSSAKIPMILLGDLFFFLRTYLGTQDKNTFRIIGKF